MRKARRRRVRHREPVHQRNVQRLGDVLAGEHGWRLNHQVGRERLGDLVDRAQQVVDELAKIGERLAHKRRREHALGDAQVHQRLGVAGERVVLETRSSRQTP
jgi:hypothetical protein